MEPSGFNYLYIYPVFSSLIAGLIFWLIFSFFPDRSRKLSFCVGIDNDLLALNNQLFEYFDFFLKFQENSPSFYQDKIHSSSLTEEDLNIALQNKIINTAQFNNLPTPFHGIMIGEKFITMVQEIDITINRLYAFNYFLSSTVVGLLRNIYENIHRYVPYVNYEMTNKKQSSNPPDLSVAFMTATLLELQTNFRDLRKIIFKSKRTETSYAIQKVQMLFYSGYYIRCMKECNSWITKFPFTSSLQSIYLIRCKFLLAEYNVVYELLGKFLENTNNDIISYRNNIYPLLSDTVICELIAKKVTFKRLQEMRELVENENLMMKNLISLNLELKSLYRQRSR